MKQFLEGRMTIATWLSVEGIGVNEGLGISRKSSAAEISQLSVLGQRRYPANAGVLVVAHELLLEIKPLLHAVGGLRATIELRGH